jgi:hypothetical protein
MIRQPTIRPTTGPRRVRNGRERDEVAVQCGRPLGVVSDVAVDGDGRPVGRLEEFPPRPWCAEAVDGDGLPAGDDVRDPVAE